MSFPPSFLARSILAGLMLFSAALPADAAKAKKPRATPVKTGQSVDHAGEYANFKDWQEVSRFIDNMVAKHQFERAELVRLIGKAHYIESAVQLIKPAPAGKAKNWAAYRERFIEPRRIAAGLQFWQTYGNSLARAEELYGVPAEVIVGIIGVETVYGKNTGNFRVMDVITTLAFSYPDTPTRQARMDFFRGELEHALLLARETGTDPFSLRGSYAGAIGWAQFMPSSIRTYAVDFDGDGVVDLRNSAVDAIGSVAHYLQQHGWRKGEPDVFPSRMGIGGKNGWMAMLDQGLEAKFNTEQLQQAGVEVPSNVPQELLYGIIDLQNGMLETEYYIGTNNFFSITKYNRSYFYAMSVLELGKTIKNAKK